MQEKLARLHFSLDVCGEEEDDEDGGLTEGLPEEQKQTMADRNLDQLLSNVGCDQGLGFREIRRDGGGGCMLPDRPSAPGEKLRVSFLWSLIPTRRAP